MARYEIFSTATVQSRVRQFIYESLILELAIHNIMCLIHHSLHSYLTPYKYTTKKKMTERKTMIDLYHRADTADVRQHLQGDTLAQLRQKIAQEPSETVRGHCPFQPRCLYFFTRMRGLVGQRP